MNQPPVPEIEGLALVAIGRFNPAILHPLWFSSNNLIRKGEAESAKVEIVHKEITIFNAEWFRLQVMDERIQFSTSDPTKNGPLIDLVLGTFRLLEHTPISSLGLNRDLHFRMPSAEEWHAVGHYFVPKKSWYQLLDNPGTRTVIVEGKRSPCDADLVQIRIEPSAKVKPFGVYLGFNQHYSLDKSLSDKDRMVKFFDILQSSWEDFVAYCKSSADHLFAEYRNPS